MRSAEPSAPHFAVVALILVALTSIVYSQTRTFDYVLFDDDEYVYANPIVMDGLTLHGFRGAFGFRAGNWHPLTWLSHMADVEAFGIDAGAHHVTNVALHGVNAILLMLGLTHLTGSLGKSAAVAAIFAAHPLNVENVAWIAERKTLLSMTFLLLTLLCWKAWVLRPTAWRITTVTVVFALGLMSKPYVITLPVLLLALDFWPLQRLEWTIDSVRTRVVEKLPLFACAGASALLTYQAQLLEGAVAAVDVISLQQRLLNAVASYAWYLGKLFWPTGLSFYYPHPVTLGRGVSAVSAGLAVVLLVTCVLVAMALRKRATFVGTGFAWFVLAFIPVIGIVQVGLQSHADRYAYLPMIGMLVAVVWSVDVALSRLPRQRITCALALTVVLGLLVLQSRAQASHWKNSETLFDYAVGVDPSNWAAWQNLGIVALNDGNDVRALACFEKAYSLYSGNALAAYNIGHAYSLREQPHLAVQWYERAQELRPNDIKALVALAFSCQQLGDISGAVSYASRAIAVAPDSPEALYGVAVISRATGDFEASRRAVSRLREIAPALAQEFGP